MARIITDPINVLYLSGFKSSNAFIFEVKNKKYLFTDSRYIDAAKKIKHFEIKLIDHNFKENIKELLKKEKELTFEKSLSYEHLESWKKIFKKSSCTLKAEQEKEKLIYLREQKNKKEIENIKKAQNITKKAIKEAKKLINKNSSELEIAWKIKQIIHNLGGEDVSFEPIIAFGKNSAIPHHQNSNKKYQKEDVILIDAGAKYKGYCGDMTRTFLPQKPSFEQVAVYEAVKNAQKIALNKLESNLYGLKLNKVDLAVRNFFKKENLAEFFTHSLGHGVGLEIHEEPRLSPKSKSVLKQGQIFSVEPGIYLPGKFGVRIEDLFFA